MSWNSPPTTPHTSTTQLILRKEAFKFAAAHMTVFPDGSKEPLHGHNFQVEVRVELKAAASSEQAMLPFGGLKQAILQICQQWDEKVLLPARSPFLILLQEDAEGSLAFRFCGKRYLLPRDEVELLPITNGSTEQLSVHFGERLLEVWRQAGWLAGVHAVAVRIEESPQQGAATRWVL